jgi:serine/threonine protein kinase
MYAGPEVDVWSLGVILYALVCGTLPFDEDTIEKLYHKINHGLYEIPAHASDQASDLIRQMLKVDPLRRITLKQVCRLPCMSLFSYTAIRVNVQDRPWERSDDGDQLTIYVYICTYVFVNCYCDHSLHVLALECINKRMYV